MKIIRLIMETYKRNDRIAYPSYIKIFFTIDIHAKILLFGTDET